MCSMRVPLAVCLCPLPDIFRSTRYTFIHLYVFQWTCKFLPTHMVSTKKQEHVLLVWVKGQITVHDNPTAIWHSHSFRMTAVHSVTWFTSSGVTGVIWWLTCTSVHIFPTTLSCFLSKLAPTIIKGINTVKVDQWLESLTHNWEVPAPRFIYTLAFAFCKQFNQHCIRSNQDVNYWKIFWVMSPTILLFILFQ